VKTCDGFEVLAPGHVARAPVAPAPRAAFVEPRATRAPSPASFETTTRIPRSRS